MSAKGRRKGSEATAHWAVAQLPTLPLPDPEQLPRGSLRCLDELELEAMEYESMPEDVKQELRWRCLAECMEPAEVAQAAFTSLALQTLGDVGLDPLDEGDQIRLRRHSHSRVTINAILDKEGRICLVQDGYETQDPPLSLAAWRLQKRGVEYLYETYANADGKVLDFTMWFGTIYKHRHVLGVLRFPVPKLSPFMKWRGLLAERFILQARQLDLDPTQYHRKPILEYLHEIASTTTPGRPYTSIERSCGSGVTSGFNCVCLVRPRHFAAHAAVWTLWTSSRAWPPWRVLRRLLESIRKPYLPLAVQSSILSFVGREFTECMFQSAEQPFEVDALDQWDWWWQLWQE
mmetsp:Transcript_60622/g.135313  ORF Transcript_60622/g.135313 Transcript_60622/m.135313 type:complete len:347 (+) Transcript_60622:41-1081(+)